MKANRSFSLVKPHDSINPRIIRRIVRHHQSRRIIKPVNEQAQLVIDGRVEGASHEGHPLSADPRLQRREEGRRGLRIVGTFEESPNAHLFTVELVMTAIYYARDPSHRLRAASRQKEDALGKLPERVYAGIQHPANLFLKGGNPIGVLSINFPRQVNEILELRSSFHSNDFNTGHDCSF
jgi:hypothetical protein